MDQRHTLLRRQLKRHLAQGEPIPDGWLPLLDAVNEAYCDYDAARHLLERALEISSRELFQANSEMRGVLQALPDRLFRVNGGGEVSDLTQGETPSLPLPWCRQGSGEPPEAGAEAARLFRGTLRQVRETQAPANFEYRAGSAGREVFYEVRILPFVEPDSIVIVRDITQRKVLESHLAHAQKLESLGHLAAGIAHELNTPIQYVGDNIQFLSAAFADLQGVLEAYEALTAAIKRADVPAAQLQSVEAAVETADLEYLVGEVPKALAASLDGVGRVAAIVQAMKEFSHPGTAQKTDADLNRLLESTITVAGNEWKYAAEVIKDFDPALPLVLCLPGELSQVFLNIIVNAAHAISEVVGDGVGGKGTITVTTRAVPAEAPAHAEIRITDTGTGIRPEVLAKIFDPFFTTKEVGKGTGQGLAIAHTIITEKHGGTITCVSEIGQGTTFIVRLPLASTLNEE